MRSVGEEIQRKIPNYKACKTRTQKRHIAMIKTKKINSKSDLSGEVWPVLLNSLCSVLSDLIYPCSHISTWKATKINLVWLISLFSYIQLMKVKYHNAPHYSETGQTSRLGSLLLWTKKYFCLSMQSFCLMFWIWTADN